MIRNEEVASVLRQAGCRLTQQRLLVVDALRQAGGHVNATHVVDEAQRVYPYLDVSTVYRTLDTLTRIGLANSFRHGSGDVNYEWAAGEPHHHLVCRGCGSVEQISAGCLDEVAQDLLRNHSFQADLTHFAIVGLCGRCVRAEGRCTTIEAEPRPQRRTSGSATAVAR